MRITHGLWELELPLQGDLATLWTFLERQSAVAQLSAAPQWWGAAELFDRTGALTFTVDWLKDSSGLAAVHRSLLVEWYADYYAHPFWQRLLNGRATRDELRRWMLRTYYLSRSVGASASRGALFSADAECRRVFRQNALEEYDHCHVFYGLGGKESRNGSTRQLPTSRLVDQHFLAIAECDEWGHALSALYQEQTAMFRKDVLSAYEIIERLYGLSGLRERWGGHLGIDVRDDHAGDFAGLFEPARPLSPLVAGIALVHSWVSAHLLLASIDEIMGARRANEPSAASSDPSYIVSRLRFIVLKALSNAREEADVVAIGDLLAAVEELALKLAEPPTMNWTITLYGVLTLDRLQTAAERPTMFRAALAKACSGQLRTIATELIHLISRRSKPILTPAGASTPEQFPMTDKSIELGELLGFATTVILEQ